VSDPHSDPKERDRQIAHNESARQANSSVRISIWMIVLAVVLAIVAFGWVVLGR
jgi:cobalamin biosynthesis Mg chelatase CobN